MVHLASGIVEEETSHYGGHQSVIKTTPLHRLPTQLQILSNQTSLN
jgi:hypothetical protein